MCVCAVASGQSAALSLLLAFGIACAMLLLSTGFLKDHPVIGGFSASLLYLMTVNVCIPWFAGRVFVGRCSGAEPDVFFFMFSRPRARTAELTLFTLVFLGTATQCAQILGAIAGKGSIGWGSLLLAIFVAELFAIIVHPISVTTCLIFSSIWTYELRKLSSTQ